MDDYYKAYDARYRTAHRAGFSWFGDRCSPIVPEILHRYGLWRGQLLEIGCGEGRDAIPLLEQGCDLLATDVSPEAIAYCKNRAPEYGARFRVLDVLRDAPTEQYDLIYAVAVVHMLVEDTHRDGFYQWIRRSLRPEGLALICSMGDGETELQTDPDTAFTLQPRQHGAQTVLVAGTSCRMISFPHFLEELRRNGLVPVEQGFTQALPDFDRLMYAVVRCEAHSAQ